MLALQAECCTCVMVAVGSSVVAVLAISDPLKPEARGVIAALHKMGLVCHLLTGDNWRTARAIAEQLGMLNVTAECLPGAKSEKVKVCHEVSSLSTSTIDNSCNVILQYALERTTFSSNALRHVDWGARLLSIVNGHVSSVSLIHAEPRQMSEGVHCVLQRTHLLSESNFIGTIFMNSIS